MSVQLSSWSNKMMLSLGFQAEALQFESAWGPDKIDLPPKFNTLNYYSK